MIRWLINLLLAGLAIALTMACPAGAAMSLEDCLIYGFENNPTVKAADYSVAAMDAERKAVRADFLPGVSTSYGFNRLQSENAKGVNVDTDYLDQYIRSFSVRISQTLYAGNRIVNSYDKAKLAVARREADRRLAKLELAYRIETAFFQLISAKEDVRILKDSVKRLEESVKSARAHFKTALISHAQVLSAEVDLADAQQQLSRSRNEVNRKRITLFTLMNLPVTEGVRFDGRLDFFDDDNNIAAFEECWEAAKANRPDLESLARQVEMAEKDVKIALAAYLPKVSLDLGYTDYTRDYDYNPSYSYDRDQRSRYWSAGITASWALFDGGRSWYGGQKSRLEIRRLQESIQYTRLSIQEGIKKALFSIDEARLRVQTAGAGVAAAEENYQVENHRLAAGLSTIPGLLDAQTRLTRAQANNIQAKLDFQLARSELVFMMGKIYKKTENEGL